MNPIRLEEDGTLWLGDRPLTSDPLTCLGCPVVLNPTCTLRSFFLLLDRETTLQRLNAFATSFLASFRRCPDQGCAIDGIEALQLNRVIEMTGFPDTPAIRIYVTLEGVGPEGYSDVKTAGLENLLDMPLRLGRLKHTVFGDQVDTMAFDTVFNLFELIDGICWELSFHNLPDRCRY